MPKYYDERRILSGPNEWYWKVFLWVKAICWCHSDQIRWQPWVLDLALLWVPWQIKICCRWWSFHRKTFLLLMDAKALCHLWSFCGLMKWVQSCWTNQRFGLVCPQFTKCNTAQLRIWSPRPNWHHVSCLCLANSILLMTHFFKANSCTEMAQIIPELLFPAVGPPLCESLFVFGDNFLISF